MDFCDLESMRQHPSYLDHAPGLRAEKVIDRLFVNAPSQLLSKELACIELSRWVFFTGQSALYFVLHRIKVSDGYRNWPLNSGFNSCYWCLHSISGFEKGNRCTNVSLEKKPWNFDGFFPQYEHCNRKDNGCLLLIKRRVSVACSTVCLLAADWQTSTRVRPLKHRCFKRSHRCV